MAISVEGFAGVYETNISHRRRFYGHQWEMLVKDCLVPKVGVEPTLP
jgi:hypothetical protein